MQDRNKVVIRLLMTERQYICQQINIFSLADNAEAVGNVITGFLLVIPRQTLLFAPHRVRFGFTGRCLYNANNPESVRYRIYQQTVRLTGDERQLRLEADLATFFGNQSFHEPQVEDNRSTYRW